MNSYELSRKWFNWAFENPEKVNPNHTSLYFFCIEHCNRLGWKDKFGLPTTMAKEAIGIKSYNTYIKTLKDLIDFGFIQLIEKSKNQYSSNIIALSNFNKANNKALDKALIKHTTKQSESTEQSNDSIIKQETIKQLNKEQFLTLINSKEFLKKLKENNFEIKESSLKIKFEFCNEEILNYIEYRKEIKKPFKSDKSIKQFEKNLKELSGGNIEIAKKILNQSIANGWQGIFELKNNPQQQNLYKPKTYEEIKNNPNRLSFD